jgi:hypothetical protein
VGKDGIRRDPAGVRGLSPFQETLARGREAFQKQDLAGAIAHFQQATTLDDKQVLGYLLLAQVQLAKGELDAAAGTAALARKAQQGTPTHSSKALMLTADLAERAVPGPAAKATVEALQPKLDAAKEAWDGYAGYVAGQSKAPDYRASATERKKQIDARLEREKAYVIVKQRIAENAREAEDKAKQDASKSAGN